MELELKIKYNSQKKNSKNNQKKESLKRLSLHLTIFLSILKLCEFIFKNIK